MEPFRRLHRMVHPIASSWIKMDWFNSLTKSVELGSKEDRRSSSATIPGLGESNLVEVAAVLASEERVGDGEARGGGLVVVTPNAADAAVMGTRCSKLGLELMLMDDDVDDTSSLTTELHPG